MKVYHGRWDDSPKEFIGEGNAYKEVYEIMESYIPNRFKIGYRQWTDDTKENNQFICDYGSWSDFLFIRDLTSEFIKEFFGR